MAFFVLVFSTLILNAAPRERVVYNLPKEARKSITDEVRACGKKLKCYQSILSDAADFSRESYRDAVKQIHPTLRDFVGESCTAKEKELAARTQCYASALNELTLLADSIFDHDNSNEIPNELSALTNDVCGGRITGTCIDTRMSLVAEQIRRARDSMMAAYFGLARWGVAMDTCEFNFGRGVCDRKKTWTAKDFVVDQNQTPYIYPYRVTTNSAATDVTTGVTTANATNANEAVDAGVDAGTKVEDTIASPDAGVDAGTKIEDTIASPDAGVDAGEKIEDTVISSDADAGADAGVKIQDPTVQTQKQGSAYNCTPETIAIAKQHAEGSVRQTRLQGQIHIFLCDVEARLDDPNLTDGDGKRALRAMGNIIVAIAKQLEAAGLDLNQVYSEVDQIIVELKSLQKPEPSPIDSLIEQIQTIRNADPMTAWGMIIAAQRPGSAMRDSFCRWKSSIESQIHGDPIPFPRMIMTCPRR